MKGAPRTVLLSVVALAVLAGGASCGGTEPEPPPTELTPNWTEVSLPRPEGSQRILVRGTATCADGHTYLTGAVVDATGETRPAAWSSTDARAWTPVPVRPTTYYGERNILYAAACGQMRLVALGAKAGGAHGYPRTSSWYLDDHGVLTEVEARPYTIFGGQDSVNVSRVAATAQDSFALTGNRVSGAAAWLSTDGTRFDVIEKAPGLASDDSFDTWANDLTALGGGWMIVGARVPKSQGGSRDPAAWQSTDGRTWTVIPVTATDEYEDLQRVILVGDDTIVLGVRGTSLTAWRYAATGLQPFASVRMGPAIPAVTALAQLSYLYVAAWDGHAYALWGLDLGRGDLHPVRLPVDGSASPDSAATVAVLGQHLILSLDTGGGSRVWTAN